eukprot:4148663-Pleurochrysis_carterae.AAC.4
MLVTRMPQSSHMMSMPQLTIRRSMFGIAPRRRRRLLLLLHPSARTTTTAAAAAAAAPSISLRSNLAAADFADPVSENHASLS